MNKIGKLIVVIAIAMIFVSAAAGAVITQDVEIRGSVADGSIKYDYANFGAFWYDLDLNQSSETMNVTVTNPRTIKEGDLVYRCEPQMISYENPVLNTTYGGYDIIGFMAEKYMCYDGRTDQLVKLLIEWDGSDDKVLSMDDPMEFPEGYRLVAQEIDLAGDKCVLALFKDSKRIDTEIVEGGNTYMYEDDDDVLVFSVEVDSVFRGTVSNLVVIKYAFLRSEHILDIDGGDNFGIMEVTSTSGGITMENDGTITLDADSEIDIMDGLYFKVADNDTTLRYYLAKTVSLVCPDCPDCPEIEPCPPCNETPCPEVTPEVIIEYVNVTVPAAEETGRNTPGFEAVFAIAGLLAIAYLVLRQKK